MMRRSYNLIFGGYEVLISTTTWCNIISKLPLILEISNFYFFDGLVIYKGNLPNPIEREFDCRKLQKLTYFPISLRGWITNVALRFFMDPENLVVPRPELVKSACM